MTPTPRMDALTARGIFGPMIEAIAEEGRKLELELTAMRETASKAMHDYETAVQQLAQMTARAEKALDDIALTQSCCDSWRELAMARLDEIATMTARAETAEDSLAFQMGINQQLGVELATLKAENEWHLASEPPKDSRSVLIVLPSGDMEIAHRYMPSCQYAEWIDLMGETYVEAITHWRNLPKGPVSV